MQKLSDLIKVRLNNHNLSTSAKSAEVIYFANQLLADFADPVKSGVKAYKFNGGTLFIGVKNSVWAQEVFGEQEKVLQKLKNRFGEKVIKKILIKSLTIN